MATSCSFRITRTAEDLAQTLTAISQRLVKLEQRMETLEATIRQPSEEENEKEAEMLNGVDQLLQECKGLLGAEPIADNQEEFWSEDENDLSDVAA